MTDKHEQAHDLAEEAIDALVDGDEKKGKSLLQRAEKMDPSAVAEVEQEIEEDREQAEHYVEEHKDEVDSAKA